MLSDTWNVTLKQKVTLIKKSVLEDKLLYILERVRAHKIRNIELTEKLQEKPSQKKNKSGM